MENINDLFVSIISSAIFSVLACGSLGWLARFWLSERLKSSIKNEYEMKLESHKADLQTKGDKVIAELRAQLDLEIAKSKIKLWKIQEKRLNIIANTHSILVSISKLIDEYDEAPAKQTLKNNEQIQESISALEDYFDDNRIFLPQHISDNIREILEKCKKKGSPDINGVKYPTVVVSGFLEKLKTNFIKKAIDQLEHDFRSLID